MASRADYKSASASSAALLTKLEALRREGKMEGRLETSSAYNKSVFALKKLEADAIASDAKLSTAAMAFEAAKRREDNERIEAEQVRLRAEEDETARRRMIEERIANLPVNRAIREHRLIEGMSYDQAVEALGKPYAISTSGRAASATWRYGEGNYWSAMFIDDVAISISNMRL